MEDLSPDVADVKGKSLYVIHFDDLVDRRGRDAQRIYGAYWSADGPGPVNKVAVSLWPKFGVGTKFKIKGEDYDDIGNVDGRHTKGGECYSGLFNSIPLVIRVSMVKVPCSCNNYDGWLAQLYRIKLLEKCLEVVGISVGGSSIPINVDDKFLHGMRFVFTGTFVEVDADKNKSNSLVTKMLESAGATVTVRMTKNTGKSLDDEKCIYDLFAD